MKKTICIDVEFDQLMTFVHEVQARLMRPV